MSSVRSIRSIVAGAAGALILGAAAYAQSAAVMVSDVACMPVEGNTPVYASVGPPSADTTLRLYFRRQDFGDPYYIVMHPLGGGNYWAVMPKPERQNEVVEFHVTAFDKEGQVLNSTEAERVVVTGDCEAKLSKNEEIESETLTIGETSVAQKGQPVVWFLCDGITHRIDTSGTIRPDPFCGVPAPPIPLPPTGSSDGTGTRRRRRPPSSPSDLGLQ
jgi:hypothetical protein